MFHFSGIVAEDKFQAFRLDWEKSTLHLYISGRQEEIAFGQDLIDKAYEMRDRLASLDTFMPDYPQHSEYPRLYLKAFEEYCRVRRAQEKAGSALPRDKFTALNL